MRTAIILSLLLSASLAKADVAASLTESYRLHTAGDLAGAIKATRSAVDEAPRQYFLWVRLGYLQLIAADYGNSAESYRKAAELNPGSVEARLGQQQSLLALGRFEESEKAGKSALELDSDNYLAGSRLAWSLMQRRKYREAADQYLAVVALYPGDVDMRLGLANSLFSAGRKADAAKSYREVLAMIPEHKAAAAGLAACK